MSGFTVERAPTAAAFEEAARDLLLAAEAEHTFLYSVLALLRATGDPPGEGCLPLVRTAVGEVVGCAARGRTLRLGISRFSDLAAVDALADDLVGDNEPLDVNGPVAETERLVRRWTASHRGRAERHLAMRNFAATAVTPPQGVPGRARPPGRRDRAVLVSWLTAFSMEALGEGDPEASADLADRILDPAYPSGMMLWEDPEPVAMAGFTGPTPTGITVLSVYTPPELRGRGYASACVAALTEHLLRQDRTNVFLSTDLSNPTSNSIYTRLGYRPVADAVSYRLAR